MRRIKSWFEKGTVTPILLVAAAFLAIAAIFGVAILPEDLEEDAKMYIIPQSQGVVVGEKFEVEVIVDAIVPVNVFSGELHFDPKVLKIASIDYNTSIADLWAELPWYSNGEGTLNFGGGTTRAGGFTGSDTLIKVTLEAKGEGEGVISLYEPKIFLHDGFGTSVHLDESGDAVFTVLRKYEEEVPVVESESKTVYRVMKEFPSTDLNGDGKQTISDISIFMLNITSDDPTYDFNLDGKVDINDLNVLLGAG